MDTVEVIAWTMAAYALLHGFSDFLHFVAQKTANKTDDKISSYFATGLSMIGKVIDLFTANSRPK